MRHESRVERLARGTLDARRWTRGSSCVAAVKSYTSARLASLPRLPGLLHMVDKPHSNDAPTPPAAPAPGQPAPGTPRRPGHRGADMRDTVAEMSERAQI